VTRLSRRLDVPAYESLRIGPHNLTTPRPLRSETREDLTSLRSGVPSIEKCISSTGILRHQPRATLDLVPHHASSLDSSGFAATGSCATPLHPDDALLLCANKVVSARPPFTSAIVLIRTLLWARRSLSTSATSFQLRHTSTYPRALPSPDVGGCPTNVAAHDALFTLLSPSSFGAKMVRARCAAASYAYSPTPGLEIRAPKAREPSPPRATPFKWARRTWETRRPKERSKGKPPLPCGKNGP